MATRIELSMGLFSLVDDVDSERVLPLSWNVTSNGYASQCAGATGRITLHRFITRPEDGLDVDHRNGDRLDNRRDNLRVCTRSENKRNRSDGWPVVSRFDGVFRRFIWDKWFVIARGLGSQKQVYCGDYEDEGCAARAFDAAMRFMRGRDVPTNFPGTETVSPRDLLIRNGQCSPKRSAYRGVASGGKQRTTWSKWAAGIRHSGVNYRLGYYDTDLEAALVYDAACFLAGKTDRMNFPAQLPTADHLEHCRKVMGLLQAQAA